MPLYTYACHDHGEFAAWGRMSESDAPQPCPSCQEPAPRALARPAIGGRGEDEGFSSDACDTGMCASEAPGMGPCCGGGGCMH